MIGNRQVTLSIYRQLDEVDPDHPVYEVVFWRQKDHSATPDPMRAWTAEEWTVSDAEAPEVLDWAREKASGRPYTVYVLASAEEDLTEKLRLYGQSPMSAPLPASAPFQLADGQ